ncbi:MAG: 16S rRNA (cytosine(1402)-N(4))-methyltransferase RsmH [Phascolarctobacterium sp.]|nr:16S rRNA (cytosine(1402)-N(4))-methyltransferase RsmH [Phascolarctobacterium sp.]
MEFNHKSILLEESTKFLLADKNGIYVDCTLGGGGHSVELAKHLEERALLIGIDRDKDAINAAKEQLQDKVRCRMVFVKENFKNLIQILDSMNIDKIDGIFFDLGVSSYQLDNPERGFSYMCDGPLDMRMDMEAELDARYVVNYYKEDELADIILRYGEERWGKRIAQFIVTKRLEKPITTTWQLVKIIKMAIPRGARQNGPHPAKRTFQAIRIEVNGELGTLENTMRNAVNRLKSGGRIGIITFHSLEDRIIKRTFTALAKGCICPPQLPVCACGKKPFLQKTGSIVPSENEIENNPRARSARLRYAIKI